MTHPSISWLLAGALALALPGAALAESSGYGKDGHDAREGAGAMHGGGHHDQGKDDGHHDRGKRDGHYGKGKGGYDWYGPDWQKTLSDEQRSELAQLHASYTKTKLPLKARARAVKAELAVLALGDSRDQRTMDTKLDELAQIKRDMLQAKYNYVSERRDVLNAEQRPSFDMDVLRKAMGGKARYHGGGARRGGHH